MTIAELVEKSDVMIEAFKKKEQREWGAEGNAIELMKQIGDLAKRIMVYEKYYFKSREDHPEYKTSKKELADEIVDVIWMAIRLSRHYEIDIEEEMVEMIDRSIKYIEEKKD